MTRQETSQLLTEAEAITGLHHKSIMRVLNRRYSRKKREKQKGQALWEDHVAIQSDLDLDFVFSIHDARVITKDLLIHYRGNKYQVLTKRHPVYFVKREVLVTTDSSGLISAWLDGNPLELVLIDKYSQAASIVANKSNAQVPIPPPVNHPWRTYGKKLNDKPRVTIH